MLGEWASRLDRVPPPTEAVLARVRSAVRHELNEQWLAAHASPAPEPQALARVRLKVREELARQHRRSIGRWFSSQVMASLAAAAVLLLGVGLVRHVGYSRPPSASNLTVVQAAQEHVDLFLEAAQVSMAADEFSDSVLSELELIYARLPDTSPSGASQAVFEALDEAFEQVFQEPEPRDSTMGARGAARMMG